MTNEHRPRRQRIRLDRAAYGLERIFFVTITTHERHAWFRRYSELAALMSRTLCEAATDRRSHLFAWCVMPDHVHLLLADEDLIAFVRLVKGRLVPAAREYERGRRLWQRSFYDHALRDHEALESVAGYIFHNPVEAGLVDRCEGYEWSGSLVWPDWREHDWAFDGPATWETGRG